MGKVIDWLKDSHRYQHILGGIGIGLLSDDLYCAVLAGCGTAGALEFKDYKYQQGWDWIDFSLTLVGVGAGFGVRTLIGNALW